MAKTHPIEDTVSVAPDGTHTFTCPSPEGCGVYPNDPDSRFTSSGWPTAEIAQARGTQHIQEHIDGTPAQDLDAFRVAHNIVVDSNSIATVDLTAYLPEA